jgi:hypothetical protein
MNGGMTPSAPESPLAETDVERGRRLGRKYVTVVFGVVALGFMALTTHQLVVGVFGVDARPLPSSEDEQGPGVTCAARLRGMEAAVERGIAAAAHAPDETAASARYRSALAPEWDDSAAVESTCEKEIPGGIDALATVNRLRVAGEQLARRHASELAPLRHDVATYLPRD